MRILVAEDESISRLMAVRAVEQLGYTCVAASDGLDAWEKYLREGADVVISDWMMPRVDGIELCRRIRAREDRRYTYFIILTALSEREYRLTGMRAGADDYLAKPLDREDLMLRLIAAERVTSLHRRLEEQQRELERLNHEFFESGRRDALTGIANRRRMQEDLVVFEEQVRREQRTCCVALFDIDHFKLYNDTYLHLTGDEVLRRVATVLAKQLNAEDAIYRYGGEEFLAIMPGTTLHTAAVQAERMRAAVEACTIPHERSSVSSVLTVSCGVAQVPIEGEAPFMAAVRAADQSLLQAKRDGRNRVVVAP
ncbi:MAG: diguanylate cyclase [Myxococcota bacterium]